MGKSRLLWELARARDLERKGQGRYEQGQEARYRPRPASEAQRGSRSPSSRNRVRPAQPPPGRPVARRHLHHDLSKSGSGPRSCRLTIPRPRTCPRRSWHAGPESPLTGAQSSIAPARISGGHRPGHRGAPRHRGARGHSRRATGRGETHANSAGQHMTEIHTEQGSAGRGENRRTPRPLLCTQGVAGSNPAVSTIEKNSNSLPVLRCASCGASRAS